MWANVEPQLMARPVNMPVSMVTTARPFTSTWLPGNGFHDVMQQWHQNTELYLSLSSLTRVIGYLLIITTSGLQLPHIIKILRTRSCEGVSLLSVAILLHSTSANVAYCINKNLPLSTWAESMPLMAQYITMMCLLLLYRGRERDMLVFVVVYVLLMLPLLLGVVPGHVVLYLRTLSLPLTLLGKVTQIHATYRRGGTGQLSRSSILLLNVRSVGRLLTSLLDTRDSVLVLCYAHACLWNSVITAQTLYYSHKRRSRRMREERKRKLESERAAAESLLESSSSGGEGSSGSGGSGGGSGSSSCCSSDSDSEIGLENIRRRRTTMSVRFGKCVVVGGVHRGDYSRSAAAVST